MTSLRPRMAQLVAFDAMWETKRLKEYALNGKLDNIKTTHHVKECNLTVGHYIGFRNLPNTLFDVGWEWANVEYKSNSYAWLIATTERKNPLRVPPSAVFWQFPLITGMIIDLLWASDKTPILYKAVTVESLDKNCIYFDWGHDVKVEITPNLLWRIAGMVDHD